MILATTPAKPSSSAVSPTTAPKSSTFSATTATATSAPLVSVIIGWGIDSANITLMPARSSDLTILDHESIIFVELVVHPGKACIVAIIVFKSTIVILEFVKSNASDEVFYFLPFSYRCSCLSHEYVGLSMVLEILIQGIIPV